MLEPIVVDVASYVLKELASIGLTKLKEKILNHTSDEPTPRVEIKEPEIRNKIEETFLKLDNIDEIRNNNQKMTELIQEVLSEVKSLSTGDPDLEVASDQIVISQQGQVKDEELDSTLTDRLKRIEKRLDEIAATRLPEPFSTNPERKKPFPGWLAIDFGTSNSTVTLFDPIEAPIASNLPKEQEIRLRQRLAQWLSSPATNALPGVNASEWENFIDDISKNLQIEPNRLHEFFQADNQDRYLEGIRQIELCLGTSEQFRRSVSKKLYQIYHEVFRIPTLESQNLIPVVLDLDRRGVEISSELEITSLNPLKVRMGREAKNNKNKAISLSTSNSLEEIISRFHHSPKRYFGQYRHFLVSVDGKQETIEVNQLIQAAWGYLIELTDDYRKHPSRSFSKGDFQKVVVTYPTITPPLVRKQVKQLVENLGIDDVQTVDEATAVVIFYLWREFGDGLNIDMEYFKTLCRREGHNWSQNVLVLDIGGGTTDLALIELTLKYITPFRNDEDQGLGGRFYQITPKLLGSSGHLQLGGELITLRMFRLLKVAIVDCLLTAITTGELQNDKLKDLILNLNERFLEKDEYKQGSLLECIDKQYPEREYAAYKDALDTAEQVLPTRWKDAPQRLQTFYTLWDYAETAKIKLGQKSAENGSPLNFTLSEQQISELLSQIGIDYIQKEQNFNNFYVTLSSEQFERAASSVITEAIGIAKALMESRLSIQNDNEYNYDTEDSYDTENEKVDWLILSGKTCNIDLVKREIYQDFSKSDYFVWNPERITFDPEFSKLATSAGACYIEKIRQLQFSTEETKELLRRGVSRLRIDVQNLFYYLPCNFRSRTQTSTDFLDIFKAGQEFYQISPNDQAVKIRNDWSCIELINIIYRHDYEGGQLQLWGSFNGDNLRNQLKQSDSQMNSDNFFRNVIKIQFEIDSTLDIRILICRKEPHYLIDDRNGDGIDLTQVTTATNATTETLALFSSEKFNHEDIFAGKVLESNAVNLSNNFHLVFASSNSNTQFQKFRYSSDSNQPPVRGLISKPLPSFPESGKYIFYTRNIDPQTNEQKWLVIGELKKPDVTLEFPCQYRVSFDEKGILRLHVGEVPYWESDNQECLLEEGCVFRTGLDLQPNEVDKERDPFCGIH